LVIFSTNLAPADLMDPAFLRRIPYKMEVGPPSAEAWRRIFTSVVTAHGLTVTEAAVQDVQHELQARHGLALAAYQPHFLIEQIVAASRFKGMAPGLHPELVALAIGNLSVGRGSATDGATLARVA